MEKIKLKNLQIAFEHRGKGTPLVLLHGGLSDSRIWRKQIDDLSNDFTVVVWDAPGCGQSSDPPEEFLLADYADCLADLIGQIGLQKPHILGISFGAGLALADLRDVLPKINIPTLLLYGDADKRSPLTVANALHAKIPNSKLVIMLGLAMTQM